MFKLFDARFRRIPGHYVVQCLLAAAAMMVVLALMDTVGETAPIASLGASTFIAFTMPHVHVWEARYMVGGYVVGVAAGVAIFLMVLTNTEHPPAAGIALGLVIDRRWGLHTVGLILGCIVALTLAKWLLRRYLRNLL